MQTPVSTISGVVVVILVDLLKKYRSWGWIKLAQGAAGFRQTPGLLFMKVMGSGHEGGFGLRPSTSHQGLVCMFETLETAQAFLESESLFQYKENSKEYWAGLLTVDSSRGQWSGQTWAATPQDMVENFKSLALNQQQNNWLVTLTRASIKPTSTIAFWRYAPAAQADLHQTAGCLLAMGLGEAPLVRQCTFSIWKDTESMLNYAKRGAHQQAIQAAYKNEFFSESMFARMRVLVSSGVWAGVEYGQEKLSHV